MDAQTAIARVNNMKWETKPCSCTNGFPRKDRVMDFETAVFTNVYVKNFPSDWTEAQVVEEMSKYGTIVRLDY